MSDENKVGLQTDPNDIRNIERLITAIDKLDASLAHLAGAGKGMTDLARMMTTMQATMVTGFAEMSTVAAKSGEKQVAERKKTADRLVAEEERAWEKLHFTSQKGRSREEAQMSATESKKLANAAKAAEKQLNYEMVAENKRASGLQAIMERRDVQLYESNAKRLAAAAAAADKQLTLEIAAENKRAANLQALIERRAVWEAEARGKQLAAEAAAADRRLNQEIAAENKRAAALLTAQQRQDLWMAEERGRQYAAAAAHQAKLEALALSGAEKQRVLNTNFTTASLPTQIKTAERAQVYSGLGGDAAARYGSAAAGADIAALRRQYELMPAATRASADGIRSHNDIMNEGHALARGLSGSLGALWLTYGSLVPLAAGAALGASLKNIVTIGKEIEYQFKFVEALGSSPVKIEDFLRVTDGTVVSVKEAAEGMRALAQNGLDAVQSLQALPTILNLAVIGEMSVGAAALSATGAVSAFGLQLGDISRVGDVFAQAAASSNTSVALMTESMKQASTVASLYHVSLEETAGALGQLAKINITGSAAGTAFTNMLTGLYSPTNQAQRALKQLNITTDDGQGGLKNSVQLLSELRVALSQYNESAQAVFLNDIFTTRGAKAASTLLTNFDELKGRINDAAGATGFMSAAVAKLEDSTEGAFKRMKNSITSSFFDAFTNSSPGLQRLITDLGTLARSQGTVDVLTSIADGALRLTNAVKDNVGAIAALISTFAVLKVGAAVIPPIMTAITVAMAEATVATVTLRTAAMTLMASLGPIALGIAAATVAWTLFVDTTSDVEKANIRLQNSIDTNIEFIDRETRALEARNKAWNPETQKFDLAPSKQIDVSAAQAAVAKAEADLAKFNPATYTLNNPYTAMSGTVGGGSAQASGESEKLRLIKAVADARNQLHYQEMSQGFLEENLEIEAARKAKASVLTQIQDLVKKGETAKTVNGEIVQMDALGNEASRRAALEAKKIEKDLLDGKLDTKQAQIELTAAQQAYNAALSGKPVKDDKKAAGDALRAELERLKVNKDLLAVEQETEKLRLAASNKAGGLGDLGLLDAENKMAKEKIQASVDAARASIAEVQGIENKRAATQKYQNQLDVANAQMGQQDLRTAIAKEALFEKMSNDATKYAAKTMADQGQYVSAFLLEYESNYGPTIKRVEQDLTTVVGIENHARLQSYLGYLEDLKKAGTTAAIGKSLTENFNKDLAGLQATISQLAGQSGESAGLSAIFTNALSASDAYSEKLETLKAQQASLQSLADANPENPKLQQDATAMLEKLRNQAEQMRTTWVSVGQSIGDSLATAFGRGGAAMGGLLQATIAYQAQKDRIDESRKSSVDSGALTELEAQAKAAKANTSAQLSYYSKLAKAAQGYFKEGSTGYKAMGAVEKAMQLASLVETVRMFAVKSSMLMGLLGLKVATDAQAAASEGSYTLVSLAGSAARATAKGIEAIITQGTGDPYTAIPRMAAMAAIVAALGIAVSGGIGGNSAPMSAEQRQKLNGTGTVLGDSSAKSESITKSLEIVAETSELGLVHTISMDNSLKQLVAGISGLASLLVRGTTLTTTSTAESLGTAQKLVSGTTVDILDKLLGGLGGKIAGSIFGGKTTVEDVGLKVNKGSLAQLMQGSTVSQYVDTKKSGGWFRGDKYNTSLTGLGSEVNDQFSKIFQSLYDTVVAGATQLGLGGSEFESRMKNFVVDIGEISTKGLTGTQIEEALTTAFSKLGDDIAKAGVGGLQNYQKVGEGYLETLARVATEYTQVNDIMSMLGKSFNVTGLAAVKLSQDLITAGGGMENLLEKSTYFIENFLSESERMNPIVKSVEAAMAGLGASNVKTMDDFKKLVLAQDLSTVAGQTMYAALLNIAPAFKEIADYSADLAGTVIRSASEIRDERRDLQDQLDELTMNAAQLAAKARAQIDSSNLKLYDELKAREALAAAYETESTALKESIDKLKNFAASIKSFRDGLVLGNLSTLSLSEKASAARNQYSATLEAARGGDATAQSGLSAAATAFLTASQAGAGTQFQYMRDYAKVQADMALLAASVGGKITDAEKQQLALDKQVAGLLSLNDTVKSGTVSVVEAIKALGTLGVLPATVTVSAGVPSGSAPTSAVPVVYATAVSTGEQAIIDELKAVKEELVNFKNQTQAADIPMVQGINKAARILQRIEDVGVKIQEEA